MTSIFKKHSINDLSLGEMLQLKRNEKKMNLKQVVTTTKIRLEYIEALENGEYDKLPDGLYGKNFLKQYCLFLGLKYRYMLPIYEKERAVVSGEVDSKNMFSRQRAQKKYFFLLPKLWRSIILVLVILAGFFYIGYRVKEIIAPPELNIFFPPANHITQENEIKISGNVEKDSLLFINDLEVITEESGDFKENINLKKGMNIITIKAQKKYGKDLIITRQVLVK